MHNKHVFRNIIKQKQNKAASSAYHLMPECWWRYQITTEAVATFQVRCGNVLERRQFQVSVQLPVILQARSLTSAQSRLPEILCSFSSQQLMLACELMSPSQLPEYSSLVDLWLSEPEQIWIAEDPQLIEL